MTAKAKQAIKVAALAVAAIPDYTQKTYNDWDTSKDDATNIAANAQLNAADMNAISTALSSVVKAFNELVGEDIVTQADLAPYAKTADLPDFTTFALKTELPDMENYPTWDELAATYVTQSMLNAGLANYLAKSDFTSTLQANPEFQKKLDAAVAESTYATKTEIADFQTADDVTTALTPYAKSADVTTEIDNSAVTALNYTYTETTFEPKALTATKGDASTITGTLTPEAAG